MLQLRKVKNIVLRRDLLLLTNPLHIPLYYAFKSQFIGISRKYILPNVKYE